MTSLAQSRLKSYLKTFVYMTICGLLLMLGGGSFFIYESVLFANQAKSDDVLLKQYSNNYSMTHHHKGKIPNNHEISRPNQYDLLRHKSYASELRVIGFCFLGVGFLLFSVGFLLAYQFGKRYQRSKEAERFPIVEASAPAQSSLSDHNRRESSKNNADFENPICFDVKEAAPNEQNHLLCNQTTQFDSQITRMSFQPYETPDQQDEGDELASVTPKQRSLFEKLFGISDDDGVANDELLVEDVKNDDTNQPKV